MRIRPFPGALIHRLGFGPRRCAATLVLGLILVCELGPAPAARADVPDPVVLTFAVMGGCRMSTEDLHQQGASNPSSANVPQLQQTLADLASLPTVPSPFFCTGDIVDNLAIDQGQTLRGQLDAWHTLVSQSSLWGRTDFVTMPGNHEMLMLPGAKPEIPNLATVPIWEAFTRERGINGVAGNGPTAESPTGRLDRLAADQTRTTFSFDRAGVHFICVNTDTPTTATDPRTNKGYAGWIPIHWITDDMLTAQRNPAVKMIFMLGHKPVTSPASSEEQSPIANGTGIGLSDQLRALFMQNSKFRAYLTGHEHMWEAHQLGAAHSPWQIIIGNGGTKLSKPWVKSGQNYFGFTVVKIYSSGKVGVVNYRRPGPPHRSDYASPNTTPAVPAPEFWL